MIFEYSFLMKTKTYLAGLAALTLVAGCSTTPSFRPWKMEDVNAGMNRQEVIQLLGTPDAVELSDNKELLKYSYANDLHAPESNLPPLPPGFDPIERESTNKNREIYTITLTDGVVEK